MNWTKSQIKSLQRERVDKCRCNSVFDARNADPQWV